MCVNISSIKRIFSNQSHYFPDIPCRTCESCCEWCLLSSHLGISITRGRPTWRDQGSSSECIPRPSWIRDSNAISWPTPRHSLIDDKLTLFSKFVGNCYTSGADPLGTIMYCTGPVLFVIREEPASKTQSIRGGEYFTPNQARRRDVFLLQVT